MNKTQLTIFDVSNLKRIEIKGKVAVEASKSSSLLIVSLSPDDQTLFSRSGDAFLILDISNHSSPVQIFRKEYSTLLLYSSMAISSNGKTIYFLVGIHLEIYDVSDKKNSVLLHEGNYWATTMGLSKDDSKIVLGSSFNNFQIFDVTDPRNPTLRSSAPSLIHKITMIAFSSEGNKVLVSGSDKDEKQLYLQVFDVTDLASPYLTSDTILGEKSKSLWNSLWFHQNKEFAFFYTKNELKIIKISNLQKATLLDVTPSKDEDCTFTASADSQRSIVYCNSVFTILRLDIDIPTKSLAHFKPNALKVLDEVDHDRKTAIALSKDEKNLFLISLANNWGHLQAYKKVTNVSFDKADSLEIPHTRYSPAEGEIWNILAGKNLVVGSNNHGGLDSFLFVINSTDQTNPFLFTPEKVLFEKIRGVALAQDENTLAFISQNEFKEYLTLNIVTFVNSLLTRRNLAFSSNKNDNYIFSMKMSQNNNVLFCASRSLLIYDTSQAESPILKASYDLGFANIFGMALSKDERTLHLFGNASTTTGQKQLQIFDVSDLTSPKLLSSIPINQTSESTNTVVHSPDEKILYLGFSSGMLMVDVQIPAKPIIFAFNHLLNEMHASAFGNNGSMLYTASVRGVTAFNITSHYIIQMNQQDFKIGGSYPGPLKVLKLNENLRFDYMPRKHKFQKVSIFNSNTVSSPHAILPLWITFDKERSYLILEPKSPLTRGTYQISVIVSTQLQSSDFIGLDSIPTDLEAQELLLNLLHGGYIDNQGYVSENLELNQRLWIDSKYQKLDREIRAILSQSYIEALGEFSVSPSLSLETNNNTKSLRISSLSKGTISLAIQLNQTDSSRIPYFLTTKTYFHSKPNINNKKSLLTLEGPLEVINEALKEIIIDLNDHAFCDGTVNVTDGINPPISHNISSISKYFIQNQEPIYHSTGNLSIQAQMNTKQPFYTGLYSIIEFDKNTFKDENNLTMEYSLEMPSEGHLPSWISLQGLNLMGTPPEQISPRHYEFVLVAKNEFKETRVPFTLNIEISFYYRIKLLSSSIGYLVSLFGFLLSLNKIYNILARKYYKYPRSYQLKLAEEITDQKISPISFIKNEIKETKNILKQLKSCGYNDFVDPDTQILNKDKIVAALENLENKYNDSTAFSHGIIQQLVINKIVMEQLVRKQEIRTRDIFDKIKNKWMDLVLATESPSQFIINSAKLERELSKFGADETDLSSMSDQPLLAGHQYNLDLLKNAILAHAFSFQNLDIETINIDVISYKKLKGNSFWLKIKRLLLHDLTQFVFLNKREIGYGIEYVIKENTLHFIGKLVYDLKDDTIVVHLKNNRGKVLRELEITGDTRNLLKESLIESVSEKL